MTVSHITWIDSQAESGWEPHDFPLERMDLCHSIGFLIATTEHYYILANSYDPATHESNGRVVVPKVAVKEMRTLCQIKI